MWELSKNWWIISLVLLLPAVILIIEGLSSDSQAPGNENIPFFERSLGIGIAWLGIWVVLHAGIIVFFTHQKKRAAYFLANGLKGMATVLSAETTGTWINNYPQVEIRLDVSIPGRQPYPVIHKECVSPLSVGQFQRGMVIPVLVDPKNPKRIKLYQDVES